MDIHFIDPTLERAVRESLGGDLTASRLAALTELTADNRGIFSVAGLEGATGLVSLSLEDNEIETAAPLAGLKALITLRLQGNRLDDLRSLAGLTGLQELTLGGFWVHEDVGVLTLEAYGPIWAPAITNIAPLASLKALRVLHIHHHRLKSIAAARHWTRLEHLSLDGYQGGGPIRDWTPLASLTELTTLSLCSNALRGPELAVLGELPRLQTLDLRGNPLDSDAMAVHIRPLEARGVRVLWEGA